MGREPKSSSFKKNSNEVNRQQQWKMGMLTGSSAAFEAAQLRGSRLRCSLCHGNNPLKASQLTQRSRVLALKCLTLISASRNDKSSLLFAAEQGGKVAADGSEQFSVSSAALFARTGSGRCFRWLWGMFKAAVFSGAPGGSHGATAPTASSHLHS